MLAPVHLEGGSCCRGLPFGAVHYAPPLHHGAGMRRLVMYHLRHTGPQQVAGGVRSLAVLRICAVLGMLCTQALQAKRMALSATIQELQKRASNLE